ncbi:hypothetical protein [Palleronia sp. LCG004]|uniref:hypothetical protein n=1 Tax=Palleronia sp. LCG004 TaxID=3079304 RepID=UPI0029422368|nr:hypothetical protein [Palleronia sp. LCG004]WOI54945.1 hypothetical protein RVY76_07660 [Palleronia sp. LCG004]
MGVYIRMAIYFACAWLSGQGVAVHDPVAGTITFQVESIAAALTGFVGYALTFIASRIFKARGGST